MQAEGIREAGVGALLAVCLLPQADYRIEQVFRGWPGGVEAGQVCFGCCGQLAGGAAEGVLAGLRGRITQLAAWRPAFRHASRAALVSRARWAAETAASSW